MTGTPCQRRRCAGTYLPAASGRDNDGRPVAIYECGRCGDLAQELKAEPPTLPLFVEEAS